MIDLSTNKSILAVLGKAIGGKTKTVKMPVRRLQKGRYRVVVSLSPPSIRGPASRKASPPFTVR